MAVYTPLSHEALAALIAEYDVGELIAAEGIAQGISNSNWLVETRGSAGAARRFILTLYERRIDPADLPYFLALLDHLAARGCPVPATVKDRSGASLQHVAGKAAALIEFMPGTSPTTPTPAQAYAVGAALANLQLAARDFPHGRPDPLHPAANLAALQRIGAETLGTIDAALPAFLPLAEEVAARWPDDLPRSTIHSDLFPDNVLMTGDAVTGLIDFYFACDGFMAYDLAVTHAAWCFDLSGERCNAAIGSALVAGYESVRSLEPRERTALALFAEGACLRFLATRAEDWLAAEAGQFRKNPMDFARRWQFYRRAGVALFANV